MSKRDEQIARMQGLMTYGITNTSKKTPITESVEGPDGKIYAIIREGSKYHIKSTTKGNELVAESFNYIGGFMNKKNNEYSSYNQASKNLELKMRSLNEAYGVNKPIELLNPDKKENLVLEMTDAMKASLARYRQIMNNASGIMNESTISASNTGNPEAPKTTGFSPKLGEPFTDNAEAKLDTDLKTTANDPEKQGEPFGDNSKAEDYKDAQYVPSGSVANKKPTGGKVVRVNEEYEETFEECDEWGSCGLPSEAGVGEIGDDAPFTLQEDADEFVGFADDENDIDESEADVDVDLDDVDIDLDDATEVDSDDTELDDIDSVDFIDDEEDNEDLEDDLEDEEIEENSEIESLKKEVQELRDMIEALIGEDDEDEVQYEMDMDIDDDDTIQESRKYTHKLTESRVGNIELPFEINPSLEYNDVRSRYGIYKILNQIVKEKGTINVDRKPLSELLNVLIEILNADYAFRRCLKNGYYDIEKLEGLIAYMEERIVKIRPLKNAISVARDANVSRLVDGKIEKFNKKLQDFKNELNALSEPEPQPESEIDDEEGEVEVNSEDKNWYGQDDEFEAQSEEEMDNAAYANAAKGDRMRDADLYDWDDAVFESVSTKRITPPSQYRKQPMTLPKTGSDKEGNYEDWNDESVYSEKGYAKQIGDSSPFDILVKETVESIMESIKKKR